MQLSSAVCLAAFLRPSGVIFFTVVFSDSNVTATAMITNVAALWAKWNPKEYLLRVFRCWNIIFRALFSTREIAPRGEQGHLTNFAQPTALVNKCFKSPSIPPKLLDFPIFPNNRRYPFRPPPSPPFKQCALLPFSRTILFSLYFLNYYTLLCTSFITPSHFLNHCTHFLLI